ncbi:MAG: DUF1385 domain-containing protein [Peptococcaceae bacterium]|jgi:uncharacterized protein YqhQ|nr:DUF1385 domain-containing protein [Peptococcaceae bacterium]
MKPPKFPYGGQAVMEGVMMRGAHYMSIATRSPAGGIVRQTWPLSNWTERLPFLKWPLIRGTVNLVDSLIMGVKALTYSAGQLAEDGESGESISNFEMAVSVVVAMGLAIGLFFLLPAALSYPIQTVAGISGFQNLIEGFLRIAFFLLYVVAISRFKDIQRVFQYHGAEHKAIFTLEAGEDLNVRNAEAHSRLHPRCGTSFLLIVMIISILIFNFLGPMNLGMRLLSRLLLLPVVAGVSYEFLRFAGKHRDNPVVACLSWPGLQLQRLTTRNPDESQIEVAIAALVSVLEAEGELEGETEGELGKGGDIGYDGPAQPDGSPI